MTHFNIQVTVQQVLNPPPSQLPGRVPVEGKREVIETLRINVVATTEREAFSKAQLMLSAAQPEPEIHLHRASCDDSGGNLVCGYPAGRTIAG